MRVRSRVDLGVGRLETPRSPQSGCFPLLTGLVDPAVVPTGADPHQRRLFAADTGWVTRAAPAVRPGVSVHLLRTPLPCHAR